MIIASLCQRDLVAVDAKASPITAANLMRDNHVGSPLVTQGSEPQQVVGIMTDRDLAIEVLARGLDPLGTCVGQLTRGALIDVPAAASVHDALEAMQRGGVRRVLVVEEDGAVCGIVSADDLIASISGELESLARALRCGFGREINERTPITPDARENRPWTAEPGRPARCVARLAAAPPARNLFRGRHLFPMKQQLPADRTRWRLWQVQSRNKRSTSAPPKARRLRAG